MGPGEWCVARGSSSEAWEWAAALDQHGRERAEWEGKKRREGGLGFGFGLISCFGFGLGPLFLFYSISKTNKHV